MTDREIVRYINNLLKERKISLESVAAYYSANIADFKSPEDFFSQQDKGDYSKFYAIADLLSDNPDKVKEYFNSELENRKLNSSINNPVDDDYMHVLTSFVYFPAYFSLAWNWTSFIENQISGAANSIITKYTINHLQKQRFLTISDWNYKRQRASSKGMTEFGEPIVIEGLGTIRVKGRVESERKISELQFYLTFENKDIVSENRYAVVFINKTDGTTHTVTLDKMIENVLKSAVLHNIDYSEGIEIIRIDLLEE